MPHLNYDPNETDRWKKQLSLMLEENTQLKNALSEILCKNPDNRIVDKAEDFQNRFLEKDRSIELLRNKIADLDRMLMTQKECEMKEDVQNAFAFVKGKIQLTERKFRRLKFDFNYFVIECT